MRTIIAPAFDSLVLAAVAAEIRQEAESARITAVLQPDPQTVALRLRTRAGVTALLCSIAPRWARCVLLPPPDGRPGHPFVIQLRARLEGARLRAAAVDPFERVLTLVCETLEGDVALVLELMGRHSNLLLLEADRIAGAFKTVTPAMSRVRPILPGQRYSPPPRDRPTPAEVDGAVLASWLAEEKAISETLVRRCLGISPPVAAHLALQAGLDPQRPAPPESAGALLSALRELVGTVGAGAYTPVWYEDPDGRPVAYAAIPLLTYAGLISHPTASMSQAVTTVIEAEARTAAFAGQRGALLARIEGRARRAERAAGEAEANLAEAEAAERWRRFGELILAYGSTAPPRAAEITVPDFDGSPVTIPLDPRRSAVANAQAYFKRHAKAAAARRAIPVRLETLRQERAYLDQLALLAAQATAPEDLRALAAEVGETIRARRPAARRRPEAPPAPRTFITAGGFRILVGRTGRENDVVTFKLAAPDDPWFHARGMPGAHVILKTDGRSPAQTDVESAAAVAAYFSQGRNAASVPVDVTARRHVRKPKGAKPGMVVYRQERTLTVAPRVPAETASPPRTRQGSRG